MSADERQAAIGALCELLATPTANGSVYVAHAQIRAKVAELVVDSPWLREALAGAWDAGTTDGQVSMLHVLLPPIEGDEKRGVDRLLSVMKADQWLEQNERNPYRDNQTGANE